MKDKPLITETVSKDGKHLILVIYVEKESSAKDIDLDISETALKLESANYELKYKFKLLKVDPDSVGAKFSKIKKTLTLTINKV
jgi:hypothetical protein